MELADLVNLDYRAALDGLLAAAAGAQLPRRRVRRLVGRSLDFGRPGCRALREAGFGADELAALSPGVDAAADPAPPDPPPTAAEASATAWSKTIVPMNDNVDAGEDDGPRWGDAERNEPNEGAFYRKVFHPPLGFNI